MGEVVGICLFGAGYWAQRSWLPALSAMVEAGEARLTVVDLPPSASEISHSSPQLGSLLEGGKAIYIPWPRLRKLDGVNALVIAAPAKRHLEVLRRGLSAAGNPRRVICEKPCGDSQSEYEKMLGLCDQSYVTLTVADHYLLRPQLAAWRADPDSRAKLAATTAIRGALLERNHEGPKQDVNLDMLVHLLNIARMLYPDSSFTATAAWFARVAERPHADITHALVQGELRLAERRIPCTFEVGKSAAEDRKELTLEMDGSTERLPLDPIAHWSYSPLLHEATRGNGDAQRLLAHGGISADLAHRTWEELEAIRRVARFAGEYPPGGHPPMPVR